MVATSSACASDSDTDTDYGGGGGVANLGALFFVSAPGKQGHPKVLSLANGFEDKALIMNASVVLGD
jgi:hypothetical protein